MRALAEVNQVPKTPRPPPTPRGQMNPTSPRASQPMTAPRSARLTFFSPQLGYAQRHVRQTEARSSAVTRPRSANAVRLLTPPPGGVKRIDLKKPPSFGPLVQPPSPGGGAKGETGAPASTIITWRNCAVRIGDRCCATVRACVFIQYVSEPCVLSWIEILKAMCGAGV